MRKASAVGAKGSKLTAIIKGAFIASALSIGLIIIYALLLQYGILGGDSVTVVNTIIKVLCAAIAALIASRKFTEKRFIIGGAAGGAYILLAFMVFSILAGVFDFSLSILADLGIGILSGMCTVIVFQVIK